MRMRTAIVLGAFLLLLLGAGIALFREPELEPLLIAHFVPTCFASTAEVGDIAATIAADLPSMQCQIIDANQVKFTVIGQLGGISTWREVDIKRIDRNDETNPKSDRGEWLWYVYGQQRVNVLNRPLVNLLGPAHGLEDEIRAAYAKHALPGRR